MSKTPVIKPLSKKRQKQLNRWLDSLRKYFETPEGDEWLTRAWDVHVRINRRHQEKAPVLTPKEEKALRFIRREQKRGRSPSVREVAKAIGLKSSRSGARMVNSLKAKGFFEI